jgi:hypothetical protein
VQRGLFAIAHLHLLRHQRGAGGLGADGVGRGFVDLAQLYREIALRQLGQCRQGQPQAGNDQKQGFTCIFWHCNIVSRLFQVAALCA